jgi:hypothetical protein
MESTDENEHVRTVWGCWVTPPGYESGEPPHPMTFFVPGPGIYKLQFSEESRPCYVFAKPANTPHSAALFTEKIERIELIARSEIRRGLFGKYRREEHARIYVVHMKERPRRIALPPGMWLNRVTRFLLTREAHRRFVEPVIADMHVEYCEALAAGHLRHARWIAARAYLLVIPGYLYGFIERTVKRVFSA